MRHTFSFWLILAGLLLQRAPARAECTKDIDCQGGRICLQRRCTDPQPPRAAPASRARIVPAPGAAPRVRARIVPAPGAAPRVRARIVPAPGATPRVRARIVPAPGAAPTPPTSGASNANWPGFTTRSMKFRPADIAALRAAGALLDEKEREIARRLGERGYTATDFILAYRQYTSLRGMYPEFQQFGRDMLETVAVGQKLRLTGNDLYWFVWYRHDRRLSLTEAYNRHVIGGPRPVIAGWVLTSLGTAVAVFGGVLWGISERGLCLNKCRSSFEEHMTEWGWGFLGLGGAILVAGLPTLIVGYVRTARWLRPGTLESQPADRYPARAGQRRPGASRPAFSVFPLLSPRAKGLRLVLTF